MSVRRSYRRGLLTIFGITLVFSAFFFYFYVQNHIPDKINVVVEEGGEFNFSLPMSVTLTSQSQEVSLVNGSKIPGDAIDIVLDESFQVTSDTIGEYAIDCKLFGLFSLKSIEVSVVNPSYVYPMGVPIGIYLETKGILIVGTGTVTDVQGVEHDPAYQSVKSGDYIVAVNGESIESKEDLVKLVAANGSALVTLTIRRDQKEQEVSITPVQTGEEAYKLGIWIRDDTQGIGTLSYVTEEGYFGALGHGISDLDTGLLVESDLGSLYEADIHSVIKSSGTTPGSMCGSIHYEDSYLLGEIQTNCSAGIYGTLDTNIPLNLPVDPVPVGYMQDVTKGEAILRSSISGEWKDYTIEILQLDKNNSSNKGMVIQVTDPELLELTGGIVQGMSGSPILQNGKMIGAVTHVFLQDPTKGYGIFMEKMLEAASSS